MKYSNRLKPLYYFYLVLTCVYAAPVILQSKVGTFTSPQFPAPYGNNLEKEWEIIVRPGFAPVVKFVTFDLEDSFEPGKGSCVYDYVKLTGEDGRTIANLCGNYLVYKGAPSPTQSFRPSSNKLRVKFVSDFSNEDQFKGFRAEYTEDDIDECVELPIKSKSMIEDWEEVLYCSQICHNTPGSYYCSCRDGYTMHPNKHTCVANCADQRLTTDSGDISSPGFPDEYSKLTNCDWTIQVATGKEIKLHFDDQFHIETHIDEGCVYDWVEINVNGIKKKYCGRNKPNELSVLNTKSNHVVIKFVSDFTEEHLGFKLTYTTEKITCRSHFTNPVHGAKLSVVKSTFQVGESIRFICNSGYILEGKSTTTCQTNGGWDNQQPICRNAVKCNDPEDVNHSTILQNLLKGWQIGEQITYRCNKWYELSVGNDRWQCRNDEKWHPILTHTLHQNIPVCSPQCGTRQRTASLTSLLAGGINASPHEYPWMVLMTIQKDVIYSRVPMVFCGGGLINANYVLTAAHCVYFRDTNRMRDSKDLHVWLGLHDREADQRRINNLKHVLVEKFFVHSEYNQNHWQDADVAVLQLTETIVMTHEYQPICLPSTMEEFGLVDQLNVRGIVAGWGLINPDFTAAVLQYGNFEVQPDRGFCNNATRGAIPSAFIPSNFAITKNMFCAGDRNGSLLRTCGGDSGSPFIVKKPGNPKKYMAVGLVSFGVSNTECGVSMSYSVFTRLNFEIVSWINNVMNLDL